MGNTCNACDYNDENRTQDIKTSNQRHLKMHTNIDLTHKKKQKLQSQKNEFILDSDIKSPHQPKNAEKVQELNKITETAIKIEDEKGTFRVRYLDDNINNGAPILGPYLYQDGETFLGQFFNGLKHGKGRMVWPDGTVYEGQWINDKRHGKGRVIYSQGDYYEGKIFSVF